MTDAPAVGAVAVFAVIVARGLSCFSFVIILSEERFFFWSTMKFMTEITVVDVVFVLPVCGS